MQPSDTLKPKSVTEAHTQTGLLLSPLSILNAVNSTPNTTLHANPQTAHVFNKLDLTYIIL